MNERNSYGALDVFRLTAALLVAANHTSPLTVLSPDADFFLTRILARTGVPFFFMVTGQFIGPDCLSPRKPAPPRFRRYLGKLLALYGVSILLYLPIGLYAGHYDGLTVLSALRLLVFDGTFYHLWYFPACILGLLLLRLLSRRLGRRGLAAVTGGLYLLGLSGDSYYGLAERIPALAAGVQAGFRLWSYTRNGLFFAPVFLFLGSVMAEKPVGRKAALPGLIISFVLMTAEGFSLRYLQWPRHDSMYLFLIPVMVFLYQLLLSVKARPRPALRTASAWLYILHPAFIVAVRAGAKLTGLTVFMENSVFHYLAVAALSAAAAFAVTASKPRPVPAPAKDRAWIELDYDALENNVRFLRSRLPPDCGLMPALKANAYGHGAVAIGRALNAMGIDAFCVATAQEGAELRRGGVKGEILVLGYTRPDRLDLLRRYHLAQTVVDAEYAGALAQYGKRLHVHIAVDTGLGRLGERSENAERIAGMFQIKNLRIDGLFTHLATADGEFSRRQAQRLFALGEQLRRRGVPCPRTHLLASGGILGLPALGGDFARPGIALYGVLGTAAEAALWGERLRPVLTLKARVACVKSLSPGESAGYDRAFTANRPTKIAVLTIGYADGLPRALSGGKGAALLHGMRAPIAGRVCMDMTLLDVTGIPAVRAGDEAVLIGRDGPLAVTAGDMAAQAGTIPNEILSRLGPRLGRENGKSAQKWAKGAKSSKNT